jgi:hypothetical protein
VTGTGIACPGDCTEAYANGTVVALTPTPAAGSTFAGWTGHADCTDASVTMDADKSCTATFNLVSSTPTIASVVQQVSALPQFLGKQLILATLQTADRALQRGNVLAARAALRMAIVEIRAAMQARRISNAVGNSLIAQIQAILSSL